MTNLQTMMKTYEALTELRKYGSLFEDLDEEQDDDLFDSYFGLSTNQAGQSNSTQVTASELDSILILFIIPLVQQSLHL